MWCVMGCGDVSWPILQHSEVSRNSNELKEQHFEKGRDWKEFSGIIVAI